MWFCHDGDCLVYVCVMMNTVLTLFILCRLKRKKRLWRKL